MLFDFTIDKKQDQHLFDEEKLWDLLIIGGGPAGINAGIYSKRKGLDVGIISKDLGGQLHNTSAVDNYLGFKDIEGKHLSLAFKDHLESLNVPVLSEVTVNTLTPMIPNFELSLSNGKRLKTKTVLITTGGNPRHLGVVGEKDFQNKGVSYCTTCDAPFFKNKHVIVAGGGNSAAEAILDLSHWASKITLAHRSNWRADQILLSKLEGVNNLDIYLQTQILEIVGNEKMTGVKVLDKTKNEVRTIDADGIFIEIGTVPNSKWLNGLVTTNERLEIIVDENQKTSVNGIYAAGDVTSQPYKQIIISAAEGAKAALAINHYLNHEYKGE